MADHLPTCGAAGVVASTMARAGGDVTDRSAGLSSVAGAPGVLFGAIAADPHRAPAAGAGLGTVVEGPSAGVVGADPHARPGTVRHSADHDGQQPPHRHGDPVAASVHLP